MQQQHNLQEKQCFFCADKNFKSCITRSLFDKYSRGADALFQVVTQLVTPIKKKTIQTAKYSQQLSNYEEVKHLIDGQENMNNFMLFFTARLELMELVQYYKYRKYVPIFSHNPDSLGITESIHSYYYDQLKLYYNEIKKKFNMTIESTFQQQTESSFIIKSDNSKMYNKSKILAEIPCKNSIEMTKNLSSQSKALNNLINYLQKQETNMKKVKKLKIQHIVGQKQQQFQVKENNAQKKSNLGKYLIQQNKKMIKKKNNNKGFIRFIESTADHKAVKPISKLSINKKPIIVQLTRSVPKQKTRRKSLSLTKQRQQLSISTNKLTTINRQKSVPNFLKKFIVMNKSQKCIVNFNSVPLKKFLIDKTQSKKQNVLLQLNRSQSSSSKTNQLNVVNGTKNSKIMEKYLTNNKEINYIKECLRSRAEAKQIPNGQKKKVNNTKTPIKNHILINAHDNLSSINRKKLEELKQKSQRKKDGRK